MSSTTRESFETMWNDPNIGSKYRAAERATLPFARELVQRSRITSVTADTPLNVLDQACGTGVVGLALHDMLAGRPETSWKLTCTDVSQPMLDAFQERVKTAGWKNTDAKISDIQKNGLLSAQYTHVFSSFVFMALPDSGAALDESFRVLTPGGTFAITTWKHVGWHDDTNAVFALMNLPHVSATEFLKALGDGEWDNPSYIENQLRKRGFEEIQAVPVRKSIEVGTAQEMISAFQPPMMFIQSRFWTEEQRQQSSDKLLPRLEEYLEDKYGKNTAIKFEGEAIVTTARKPTVE